MSKSYSDRPREAGRSGNALLRSVSLPSQARHASSLVLAEYDGAAITPATLATVTAAGKVGPVTLLVAGRWDRMHSLLISILLLKYCTILADGSARIPACELAAPCVLFVALAGLLCMHGVYYWLR